MNVFTIAPMAVQIRPGSPSDQDTLLAFFDEAVVWLANRGLSDQWGSQPWSSRPEMLASVTRLSSHGGLFIAEIGSEPVGALVISEDSPPYVPRADVPSLYIELLIVSRRFAGHKIGAALLAHARAECRLRKLTLLRVDCWAGGERRLVQYYETEGFTSADAFLVGDWAGQLLIDQIALDT